MFAHILHKKFMPCSAFLYLKEETGKWRVMGMLRLFFGELPCSPQLLWVTNSMHRTTPCTASASFQNAQDSLRLSISDQLACRCATHYDEGHRRKVGERQGKPCLLLALALAATYERSSLHLAKPTASTTGKSVTIHSAPVCFCMLYKRRASKVLLRLGRKRWFTFRNTKTPPPIQRKSQNHHDSFPNLPSTLLRHPNLAINFCRIVFRGQRWCARYYWEFNTCITACVIWLSSSSRTSSLEKL